VDKFIKIFGGVLVFLLVLAIALTFLVRSLLTPEMVKQKILPQVSATFGIDVDFSTIDIGILSGITIKDISITTASLQETKRSKSEKILSAKEADLRYDLWPILQGKIVIQKILLQEPEITIHRNKDGKITLLETLSRVDSDKTPGDTSAKEKPEQQIRDNKGSSDLNIEISTVEISDGKVTFIDAAVKHIKPLIYNIEQIQFKARDISMENPFPFSLKAEITGAPFSLQGKADLARQQFDCNVGLKGLDIALFSPYFQEAVPGMLSGPVLSLDIRINQTKDQIVHVSGDLNASSINFTPKEKNGIGLKNGNLRLKLNLDYGAKSGVITLQHTLVSFAQQDLTIAGKVAGVGKSSAPLLDLAITGKGLDLKKLIDHLTGSMVSELKRDYTPRGTIDCDIVLDGPMAQPKDYIKSAAITLHGLGIIYEDKPLRLDGAFHLQGARLSSAALKLTVNKDSADLYIEMPDIWKKPVQIRADLTANRLDMNPFLVEKQADRSSEGKTVNNNGPSSKTKSETSGKIAEPDPIEIPLNGAGVIKVSDLLFKDYEIKDLVVKWRLRNNVITFDQSCIFAGGRIEKKGEVDLRVKGFRYKSKIDIQKVHVEQLLPRLAPAISHMITGQLNLDGTFSGRGVTIPSIKKNINAQGLWSMISGSFETSPLIRSVISLIGIKGMDRIAFDKARGNFKVRDGVILFRGAFNSNQIGLNPVGRISLDGPISLDLNVKLSPEMSKRLNQTARAIAITRNDGWTEIPLKITGTLTSPKVSLGAKRVIEQKIQEEAGKLLRGLFN